MNERMRLVLSREASLVLLSKEQDSHSRWALVTSLTRSLSLSINPPFSSMQGTGMQLQLIGMEKAVVEYTDSTDSASADNDQRSQARTGTAQRPLIQADLPLDMGQMIQNGRIAPGKYKMPFDVELPDVLPSSMQQQGMGKNQCTIAYTLKAVLKGSGHVYNFNCERECTVKAKPLEKGAQPFEGEPVREQVKMLCCLNRGSITVGAFMADTCLEKGETAQLTLSCLNNSAVGVKRVEAVLMQYVKWEASVHNHTETKILQKLNFGAQGLQRKDGSSAATSEYEEQVQMLKALRSGANAQPVTMPGDALNTYRGKLVFITHELLVRVVTGSCVDNPEIKIPIRTGESGKATTTTAAGGGGSSSKPPASLTESAVVPPNFENAVSSETAHVSSNQAITGGAAIAGDGGIFKTSSKSRKPSTAALFKEMRDSVADLDIVRKRIADPAWKRVFVEMSATDFGQIVKLVDLDHEQAKVAAVVAAEIPNFTCSYVVGAVHGANEWNKSSVCEKLVPFCTDLALHKGIILAELSDWDQTVTERAFEKALADKA